MRSTQPAWMRSRSSCGAVMVEVNHGRDDTRTVVPLLPGPRRRSTRRITAGRNEAVAADGCSGRTRYAGHLLQSPALDFHLGQPLQRHGVAGSVPASCPGCRTVLLSGSIGLTERQYNQESRPRVSSLSRLALQECEQVGVESVLVGGCEAVGGAGVVDLLNVFDE
jgi:hypothetical protein